VVLAQEPKACFNAAAVTSAICRGASSGRKNTAPSASPSTNASKLCPLTVAFEHFQGGKDLQQVLLAANRKNDLSLLATKMILITFAVCASVAAPTSSSGGQTFELADASATGSD
jgi:spore coat protein CotH